MQDVVGAAVQVQGQHHAAGAGADEVEWPQWLAGVLVGRRHYLGHPEAEDPKGYDHDEPRSRT